mgnify:FL=1
MSNAPQHKEPTPDKDPSQAPSKKFEHSEAAGRAERAFKLHAVPDKAAPSPPRNPNHAAPIVRRTMAHNNGKWTRSNDLVMRDPTLSQIEKNIFNRIAHYAALTLGRCIATNETIASDLGCSIRAVLYNIQKLEDLKAIRVTRRTGKYTKNNLTNIIDLVATWKPAAARDRKR